MDARRSGPPPQPVGMFARFRLLHIAALVLGLGLVAGCGDADGPLVAPQQQGGVQIPLAPRFHAAAANFASAPINRVRITAVNVATGQVVGTAVVDVDPNQTSWSVPFEVDLPPGAQVTLEVLIELVNVTGGVETTQWSGEVTIPGVTPGQTPEVQSPELVPGPPENLNITGVTITGSEGPVVEGAELDLAAAVQGGVTNPTLVWTALTPDVATVDQAGHVVTLLPGTARFQVLAGNHTATHEVTVTQRAAVVTVSPVSSTLAALGAEASFSAQVLDPRGEPVAGEPAVVWSVSEGSAVSMTGPGRFRAEANGAATVRAALAGAPEVHATATITVQQAVATLAVNPAGAELDGLGSTAAFSAAALDANGHPVADVTFQWSTENTAVATVDAAGLVTAAGVGTTAVHAAAGGADASAPVTVTQTVAAVEVTPATLGFDALGADAQLTATAADRNGHPMDVPLTWTSANPLVAVVSASGVVTAVNNGQAYVFVTAPGNARADVLVTIEQVVTDIQVEPTSHVFEALGATKTFTAIPVDRAGSEVRGQSVSWASSNTGVVTVTDNGNNSATARAVANGDAFVEASAAGVQVALGVKVDAQGPGKLSGPILLYHADGSYAADSFRSNLIAIGVPANQIQSAAMGSTPIPLANLVEFGCVIAWTNYGPPSPAAVGDRLKEYVDAGGRVVLATYGYSLVSDPWDLSGGIMGAGYSPFLPGSQRLFGFPRSLDFNTAMTGHPLLAGVSEFTYGGNSNYATLDVNGGGVVVARDNHGVPLLGVNPTGAVTGVNVYPGGAFQVSNGVFRVFANACAATLGTPPPSSLRSDLSHDTLRLLQDAASSFAGTGTGTAGARFPRTPPPNRQ